MNNLRRKKLDMSAERKVLTALITSTPVLKRLMGIVEARLFESSFARIIATWVLEYYKVTDEAPHESMVDIFQRKCSSLEEEDRDMIEDYLGGLSADWEGAAPNNTDYTFDTALHYFKIQSLVQLTDKLQNAIKDDNPAQAEKLVGSYTRPEKIEGSGVDLFKDVSSIQRAFDDEDEILFRLPGDLGDMIGDILREDFVAFLAPPKRGKSWWMMYIAIRASMAGLNTVVINLEMEEKQSIRRYWRSLQGASRKGGKSRTAQFFKDGDKYGVETVDKKFPRVNTDTDEIEKFHKQIRKYVRAGSLRLETFPTKSLSVNGLETLLDNMELYENKIPDVVVLDYADIMNHNGSNDERHKINNTWERLRGLAQKRHIALITASQSGRKTVTGKKDADESDIAEDIRKVAHVTKLITINQTREEKKAGYCRLAARTQREGEGIEDTVVVTQCLDIGRPYMDSKFSSKVNFDQGLPEGDDDD